MTIPKTPEPDLKDWTWAITEPCPDCGFDPRAVARSQVPALTRRYVADLQAALRRTDADTRPDPEVWSPVEYACHVRDVCQIFDHRLHRMLTEDAPQFENWNQDDTALERRYWEQRAGDVSPALGEAAATVAASFGQVGEVDAAQWTRRGRRSDGSQFTVDTLARYFLHDLAHHVWDVTTREHRA